MENIKRIVKRLLLEAAEENKLYEKRAEEILSRSKEVKAGSDFVIVKDENCGDYVFINISVKKNRETNKLFSDLDEYDIIAENVYFVTEDENVDHPVWNKRIEKIVDSLLYKLYNNIISSHEQKVSMSRS